MASCNHHCILCIPLRKNKSKFEGVTWVGVVVKVGGSGGLVKSHKI